MTVIDSYDCNRLSSKPFKHTTRFFACVNPETSSLIVSEEHRAAATLFQRSARDMPLPVTLSHNFSAQRHRSV